MHVIYMIQYNPTVGYVDVNVEKYSIGYRLLCFFRIEIYPNVISILPYLLYKESSMTGSKGVEAVGWN